MEILKTIVDHPQLQITLGESLKQLRKKNNLGLVEVSEKTGKAIAEISLIEHGKRNISIQEMQRMANAYGMDISIQFKKLKKVRNAPKVRIPKIA